MNARNSIKMQFAWPLGVEQVHKDCREWLSEIAHWKSSLAYLEKTMRHYLSFPLNQREGKQLSQLFNHLRTELRPAIRYLEGNVYKLQRELARISSGKAPGPNRKHAHNRRIYQLIKDFRIELQTLKSALFELLAEVLRKENRVEAQSRGIWTHHRPAALRRSG